MILVDTSVWIDHFHDAEPRLVDALMNEDVLVHPFVVGELACGNLRDREEILHYLTHLPVAAVATHEEALAFIDNRSLSGRGLGYIDVHLLASTALHGSAQLWTKDARLREIAKTLRLE